jgi:uncharacterized protein (UPF0261 family)
MPCILIVGTLDTKHEELIFLRDQVALAGGRCQLMDVGVLGRSPVRADITAEQVAQAAGFTLTQVAESGDENLAMQRMARGAALLAAQAQSLGEIDGLIALGGTMGTDLALDVALALPLGVPKLVLSTVAFSPLLPADRLPADLMMMLWAGGLFGLNSLCRSSLAQAAGAVMGACRQAQAPRFDRPVVGMTSLGSSVLRYMLALKPELEQRGFELAVFHTTGMGGRAFEMLAAQGRFACVMDFSLQELVNHLGGSIVSAGADRLTGAGRSATPQIVAPGATDMVDFPAGSAAPVRFSGRPVHAHNRLIASVSIDAAMRQEVAAAMMDRLAQARGLSHLVLPLKGIEGWDREGEPMHDPEGLAAFFAACRARSAGATTISEIEAHINDDAFVQHVLSVFDRWLDAGLIVRGQKGKR